MTDSDRILRAGNFVFGLMDEVERKRAERDLESDAAFRAAVNALSDRMAEADVAIAAGRRPRWEDVSASLAELPQMQGRFSAPPAGSSVQNPGPDVVIAMTRRQALLAGAAVAAGIIAAFCLGYVAGL